MLLLVLLCSLLGVPSAVSSSCFVAVVYDECYSGDDLCFAGRELRRYLYETTRSLPSVYSYSSALPGSCHTAWLLPPNHPKVVQLVKQQQSPMTEEGHLVISTKYNQDVIISGGSETGMMYGVYTFAELLGVAFTLDGDVIPSNPIETFPKFNFFVAQPEFPIRGLQPFHDFAEGPDWWTSQKWKSLFTQMQKLKMNFIGIHTYPDEPAVWIGVPSAVKPNGGVTQSYWTTWMTTVRNTTAWGYMNKKTSDYSVGSGQLYSRDCFGNVDVLPEGFCYPTSEAENNELFDNVGQLWNTSFNWAKKVGIKTAIGTQTPLPHTFPGTTSEQVYEAIFTRIMKTHPLDYYWIWTPENFEWANISVTSKEWKDTIADLNAAISASTKLKTPFGLATSGWQLGPRNDRTALDKALPGNFPLSTLARDLGYEPTDKSFLNVTRHRKWTIPWMEDDPGLTSSELWVNRTLSHAMEAKNFGLEGFIGIHWRTVEVMPQVSALAKATWDLTVTDRDIYTAFCSSMFGFTGMDNGECTSAFLNLDSFANGPFNPNATYPISVHVSIKLPRPVNWINGPGGIRANATSLGDIAGLQFIAQFRNLSSKVKGAGNRDRFMQWSNQFESVYNLQELTYQMSLFDKVIAQIKKDPSVAAKMGLPALNRLSRQWEVTIISIQTRIASIGTLGTLTNVEQHSYGSCITNRANELQKYLKNPIPPSHFPTKHFLAPSRIFSTAVRSAVEKGVTYPIEVTVGTSGSVKDVEIYFRPMGSTTFKKESMDRVAAGRNVFQVMMTPTEDFEYYVAASVTTNSAPLLFPASAADQQFQTVVVM